MIFDDENMILSMFREQAMFDANNVLFQNGNSFERKLYKRIMNKSCFIPNNAHDALPPDYYSDECSMMFDVMQVNDSEQKKSYNPVLQRMRKNEKEIVREFGDFFSPDCKIICNSESDDLNEHLYRNYVKNAQRVINQHISKIPIWVQEHPEIKYKGIFIFDDTEVYYEGISCPTGYKESDKSWFRAMYKGNAFHKPWLDKNFVSMMYDSPDVDFFVWFMPWKPHGFVRQCNMTYSACVIADARYPFAGYVNYSDTLVC